MKKIVLFAVVVVSLCWLGLGLDFLLGNDPSQGLGILLFILAPVGMAIAVSIKDKGLRLLGLRMNLKHHIRWYVFALVLDFVLFSILFLTGYFGNGFENKLTGSLTSSIVNTILATLPMTIIKNICEEIGWRGYLSNRLLEKMDFRIAAAVTGLIWGTWHLPYWLIITPRETFLAYSPYTSMVFIVAMNYISLISLSFLYNRIRVLANSVWPVILLHTMNNVFVSSLFLNLTYHSQTKWLLSPAINGVIYLALLFGVNLYLGEKHPLSMPGAQNDQDISREQKDNQLASD